jgi:hypothetical protein
MANRTAEQYAVRKGVDRTEGVGKFLNTNYPGYLPEGANPLQALPGTGFGSPGTERGNSPTQKDAYLFGMISIHYMLPSQVKCPPLK